MCAVTERVTKLETVVSDVELLKSELGSLKAQLAKQENLAVSCDLRLHGIPFVEKENLLSMFQYLCNTIGITPPNVKSIFRLNVGNFNSNNRKKPDGIIIIKLATPYDKNFILKSIANFKKSTHDLLRLHHAGFESDVPIYVNESLTKDNHTILQAAIGLRKRKQLTAAFTLRGLVHVKFSDNDVPTRIDCIAHLHSIVGSRTAVEYNNSNNMHTDDDFFRASVDTQKSSALPAQ